MICGLNTDHHLQVVRVEATTQHKGGAHEKLENFITEKQ